MNGIESEMDMMEECVKENSRSERESATNKRVEERER